MLPQLQFRNWEAFPVQLSMVFGHTSHSTCLQAHLQICGKDLNLSAFSTAVSNLVMEGEWPCRSLGSKQEWKSEQYSPETWATLQAVNTSFGRAHERERDEERGDEEDRENENQVNWQTEKLKKALLKQSSTSWQPHSQHLRWIVTPCPNQMRSDKFQEQVICLSSLEAKVLQYNHRQSEHLWCLICSRKRFLSMGFHSGRGYKNRKEITNKVFCRLSQSWPVRAGSWKI